MKTCARASARGFTIVELMIVVGTIAVLSSIAIPQFARMSIRARVAERDVTLRSIAKASQDWVNLKQATTLNFALSGALNPPGPITPEKKVFDKTMVGWDLVGFEPTSTLWHQYTVRIAGASGSRAAIVIVAMGDLDRDGDPSVYMESYELLGSMWNKLESDLMDDF